MGEFPAVTGYSNGLPLEILFMERIDLTNVRLSANPEGIAKVADLKGKKIGVAIGSTSHYHMLQALSQERPQAGRHDARQSDAGQHAAGLSWPGRSTRPSSGSRTSA